MDMYYSSYYIIIFVSNFINLNPDLKFLFVEKFLGLKCFQIFFNKHQ